MLCAILRQWLQPKEFRIAAPRIDEHQILTEICQLGRSMPAAQPRSEPREFAGGGLVENKAELARLGTQLWRLGNGLRGASNAAHRETNRRLCRHLEAALDVLNDLGLEIFDPTGTPYDAGLSLKALAFQPVRGLARDIVLETVRPGVILRGISIQLAEVIVGTVGTP